MSNSACTYLCYHEGSFYGNYHCVSRPGQRIKVPLGDDELGEVIYFQERIYHVNVVRNTSV